MIDEFQKLQERLEQLTQENNLYKTLLEKNQIVLPALKEKQNIVADSKQVEEPFLLSPQQKIMLYRSYFRGRDDVYAIRWENKQGKSGYSPVCLNEWQKPLCQKPKIKCGDCINQNWKQLTTQVIYDHLVGKHLIGIYPLLPDDRCYFLVLDFDKNTWQSDVVAFAKTCEQYGVPILIEKSQSGNGAHVWIFFDEAVPASMARSLGTALLTLTMQNYPHLSFSSYDRLFPNQDTLPIGGFGNLIALPLQGTRRKQFGFSTFVDIDNEFLPYADPWKILSSTKKLTLLELVTTLKKISETSLILDVPRAVDEEGNHVKPWEQPLKLPKYPNITEFLPSTLLIVKANLFFIPIKDLPPKLINQIQKIATFQNPEFYRAQAMRLSTFGKPRIINCSERFDEYIALPRGCEQDLYELFAHYKIEMIFEEKRIKKRLSKIKFNGKLLKAQKEAVKAMLGHDIGTLSATTGFGKTVLAAHMIAKRKTNTLILVHRQQLLEQWQERLSTFLNISIKEIGIIGGGKHKPSFRIDIAMMQSLIKKDVVSDIVSEYGQIIVDECHHISAFSFEQVLKKAKAFYVLGLTATPIRKDGHQLRILAKRTIESRRRGPPILAMWTTLSER